MNKRTCTDCTVTVDLHGKVQQACVNHDWLCLHTHKDRLIHIAGRDTQHCVHVYITTQDTGLAVGWPLHYRHLDNCHSLLNAHCDQVKLVHRGWLWLDAAPWACLLGSTAHRRVLGLHNSGPSQPVGQHGPPLLSISPLANYDLDRDLLACF